MSSPAGDRPFALSPESSQRSRLGWAVMTVARIVLGLAMMPYGFDKLFAYQFSLPAWSYAQPLGETSGKVLTWAMMGYSPRLQMLLGVFELVPALLLLNARTRRLGALLLFPVLLNVVLINFSLDLWRNTKAVSSVLLAIDLFLLLYDGPFYLDLLRRLLAAPVSVVQWRFQRAARTAGFVLSVVGVIGSALMMGASIVRFQNPVSDFIGFRQINGSGTWTVESLRIDGQPVMVDAESRFFFDRFNTCVYGDAKHANYGTFDADKSKHTFEINAIPLVDSDASITGRYKVEGERLRLEGVRDNRTLRLVLRRSGWGTARYGGPAEE